MSKNKNFFYILVVITLTLLPIFNIIKMINYGDNNLSNDYIGVILPITRALDGQLDLKSFIVTSWFRSHFSPVTMMVTIVIARFAHWNIYVEMYLGLILMVLRLILLWDLFTQDGNSTRRLLMLPILSALIFSPTQSTIFTWGGVAEPFGILSFFCTLGIWALVRFQDRASGIWLMAISGVMASWTWGAGIITWPLYFIALLLLNYRKISSYLVWFGAACIAVFPYVYFTFKAETQAPGSAGWVSFFNYKTVLQLFGASLTQYKFSVATPLYGIIGIFGVLVLFILVALGLKRITPALFKQSIPPVLIGLWGILGAWLISIGRTDMAPWYNTITMNFWIGLVGFTIVLLFDHLGTAKNNFVDRLKDIYFMAPAVALLAISVIYLRYNVFEKQYPFYLPSRAPVSAACLRHYRTAPTYCEGTVYQWGIGYPGSLKKMAQPLEEHQLSAFAPHQIWTLQGEYIFENVQVHSPVLPVSWWTGLNGEKSTWQDYKHLDLLLPAPASIAWKVDLSTLESANLKTAIGINANYANTDKSESVVFIISIKPDGEEEQVVYQEEIPSSARGWKTVRLDLKDYLGKKITVEFAAQGDAKAGAWAMYRFPVIDIHQDQQLWVYDENVQYEPENVGVSDKPQAGTGNNFVLDGRDENLWQMVDMKEPSNQQIDVWLPKQGDVFLLQTPINVCLANYSDILVEIAVTETVIPRYITLYLTTNQGMKIVELPLASDGNMHSYTYPLRLLELEPYGFLQKIYLDPHSSIEGTVKFDGIKLIRSARADSDCGNYYPSIAILPETVVGEIALQNSVTQTFVSECKGAIDSLDLYSATYARDNTQPLIITLTDLTTGDMAWTQSIPGIFIENNGWEIIAFDPISGSYQKEYQINLQSPASIPGDAVTIYQSQTDQYALGELNNSGASPTDGDLVFRYHCSPTP